MPFPTKAVPLIGGLLGAMWVLEIADQLLLDGALDAFGIRPRDSSGLTGILAAPFLHGGFGHLAANSAPFAVLGALVTLRGFIQFVVASLLITVIGGGAVWLLASPTSVHIGASGVVFGYLGFLLLIGAFERSLVGLLISGGVGFAYGGVLWGVLPGQPGVSWQSHLFGFLAGVLAAWFLRRGSSSPRPTPS